MANPFSADSSTAQDQKTSKELELVINSLPQLAFIARPDGFVYWYNQRFFEYTGLTFEDLQGDGWKKIQDPKLLPDIERAWQSAVTTGQSCEGVVPLKGKDSHFRWFMARVNPVKDENGQILRWVGTNTDIDKQTRLQKQLSDTFDTMRDGFIAIDKDWKITQINFAVLKDFDAPKSQFIGRDFREIFLARPGAEETKYWGEYHRLMRDRVPVNFVEYYEPVNKWTAVRAFPTSEGGMTVLASDVSEEKKAEQVILAAKEEAERANQLKSAFLANMSHEIRTPLGAMIGFANLLKDENLTQQERLSYIDILTRNGEQLSFIINDILDLSKVEAGHLSLEYLKIKPEQVASDVVSLLKMKAQEKNLTLEYLHDVSTPNEVTSDPMRVRQVLINLVNNAVKFTPSGSVQIKSSGHLGKGGRRVISFEVIDTGIGIARDQQDFLFEMFVQADGTMTRRFGGTGLGLALSRKLARSLGGDVIVKDSQPNQGSTFLFTFEDRPEFQSTPNEIYSKDLSEQPLNEETFSHLAGLKILVIDDSADNQHLITKLLTKVGSYVMSAENGFEGFEKALTNDYDVILMDIQMPLMDGYTATQKLRERGYTKPIIALTAHALREVKKKALQVGCTDHLSKPINPKTLYETLARYS